MTIQPIVLEPHKILHAAAREVTAGEITSAKIQRLILDMKETLQVAPDGVGLAAPQVGERLKIFLVSEEAKYVGSGKRPVSSEQDRKRAWELYAFINPTLIRSSRKKSLMDEGCLSLPGKYGEVARSEKLELSWIDESGKKHTRGFRGFFARVIQHELDHLSGILITSRAKHLVSIHELARKETRP